MGCFIQLNMFHTGTWTIKSRRHTACCSFAEKANSSLSSLVDFRILSRTCSASKTIIARNCQCSYIENNQHTFSFSFALDTRMEVFAISYIVDSNRMSRNVQPHLLRVNDRILSQGISKLLHALDPRDIYIFGFCNSFLQLVC